MQLTVDATTPTRLDVYLVGRLDDLSRSRIQSLIKDGSITINGAKAKPKDAVVSGDTVAVEIPDEAPALPQPQDIALDILFEDEHLIVIDKASGLVVHPAAGNPDGTVVNALLHHCSGQLASIAGDERPGIVHRLDKDTSGCLVAAKTDQAHTHLVAQFANRSCAKRYLAVVQAPLIKPADSIFTHIGRHPVQRQKMAVVVPPTGKTAITDYETLAAADDGTSLILCHLHTGRTHQIRVHMVHAGAAILGDPIYAKASRQKRQPRRLLLHAWQLEIDHPITGERLFFTAPIPEPFQPWTDIAGLKSS